MKAVERLKFLDQFDRSSDFTKQQLDLVRRALLDLRDYGGPSARSPLTWRRILEMIGEKTDLQLEHPDNIPGSDNPDIQRKNSEYIKVQVEKLRKFVKGDINAHYHERIPRWSFLRPILEFLLHEDIRLLSEDALCNADISMDVPRKLCDFLWERQPNKDDPEVFRQGLYISRWVSVATKEFSVIEITPHSNLHIASLVQTTFRTSDRAYLSISHGWAIQEPTGRLQVYLKPILDAKNRLYVSTLTLFTDSFMLLIDETTPIHIPESIDLLLRLSSAGESGFTRTTARDIARSIGYHYAERLGYYVPSKAQNLLELRECDIVPEKTSGNERLALLSAGRYQPELPEAPSMGEARDVSSDVIKAIERNDLRGLERLVTGGANVNVAEPETRQTALHYIAALARVDALRIIATRDDLKYNTRDAQGRLPSHLSIANGSEPGVTRFLRMKEYKEAQAVMELAARQRPDSEPSLE